VRCIHCFISCCSCSSRCFTWESMTSHRPLHRPSKRVLTCSNHSHFARTAWISTCLMCPQKVSCNNLMNVLQNRSATAAFSAACEGAKACHIALTTFRPACGLWASRFTPTSMRLQVDSCSHPSCHLSLGPSDGWFDAEPSVHTDASAGTGEQHLRYFRTISSRFAFRASISSCSCDTAFCACSHCLSAEAASPSAA
jgi:hypothetical protein